IAASASATTYPSWAIGPKAVSESGSSMMVLPWSGSPVVGDDDDADPYSGMTPGPTRVRRGARLERFRSLSCSGGGAGPAAADANDRNPRHEQHSSDADALFDVPSGQGQAARRDRLTPRRT